MGALDFPMPVVSFIGKEERIDQAFDNKVVLILLLRGLTGAKLLKKFKAKPCVRTILAGMRYI